MKKEKQSLMYPINIMIDFGSYKKRITIRHIQQSFDFTDHSYADFIKHNNITKNKMRFETPLFHVTAKTQKVIRMGGFASLKLLITSASQCIYEYRSTKNKNFVEHWKTYLSNESSQHFNINGKWLPKEKLDEVNCAYDVWDDVKVVTALMFAD